jgi:serine/threonine protein kinase
VYNDDSTEFREDAISKGYEDYPFCIVMEAASCSLKRVIDQQFIAGNAWHIIRSIVNQLSTCLQYLHGNGVVHGDLKPLNVLQTQFQVKLIDFDASVRVGEIIGKKYSSCYIPPEMVTVVRDPTRNEVGVIVETWIPGK